MKVKQIYGKNFYDENLFDLTLSITDSCNFSCKYCYNKQPRHNIYIDLNKLFEFIKYIRLYIRKTLQISILGGEPTLHPQLLEFCKNIKELDEYITIYTYSNMTASIEYYEQLFKYSKVIFTWHGQHNNFINKLDKLLNTVHKNIQQIIIMYEHLHINESLSIFNSCKNDLNYKNTYIQQIFSTKTYNINYSIQQLELFKQFQIDDISNFDKNEYIIIDNDNNKKCISLAINQQNNIFNGWLCKASKDSIYISESGDIYPCGGMIFNGFKIGHINDKYGYVSTYINSNKMTYCVSKNICCQTEIKKINIFNKDISLYEC